MKGNTVLLVIASLLLITSVSISYKNSRQINELRQENSFMLERIDSLISLSYRNQASHNNQVPDSLSYAVDEAAYEIAETGNGLFEFFNAIIEGISNGIDKGNDKVNDKVADKGTTKGNGNKVQPAPKPKMVVTSKYRMEDRYVEYRGVELPDCTGSETGQVDLAIRIDKYGDVKFARLRDASGISDEDVIDACKKAALKTKFNSNIDLDGYQAGSITYFFKME